MSRFYAFPVTAAICFIALADSNSARAVTFTHTQSGVTYTVVEADPFLSGRPAGAEPGVELVRSEGPAQDQQPVLLDELACHAAVLADAGQ